MKAAYQYILAGALAILCQLSYADSIFPQDGQGLESEIRFECGNRETALASLTQSLMDSFNGDNTFFPEEKQQLAAIGYFYITLEDCKCQAKREGMSTEQALGKCFLKSKRAALVYGALLSRSGVELSDVDLSDLSEQE